MPDVMNAPELAPVGSYARRGLFGHRTAQRIAQKQDGEVTPMPPSALFGKPPESGRFAGLPNPYATQPINGDPDHIPLGMSPLGGSMRQPFDYDAAMAALAGDQRKVKTWQKIAAVVGDTAASLSGRQPMAVQSLLGQEQAQKDRLQAAAEQLAKWKYQDFSRQNEADLQAANPFTIGRDRVAYNPATGQADVIYDGADDFDLYASALGYEPGSQDYFKAVEDYVLRGSGPSAHGRDLELDDYRTGNDLKLEGARFDNRVSLENLRQSNRGAMESERQGNRMELRRTPPARRSIGGRPASPVSVSSPAEANKLPVGTRYRTPDGQVFVR